MGRLTENKPKCLISVKGTTILQTVSIAFPGASVIIIGDYKADLLESYLEVALPDFDYRIVRTNGAGTNSGITEALNFIPNKEPFAITWSDLFYQAPVSIPDENKNYIGVTNTNKCRYSFENGKFAEGDISRNGIIGLFLFKEKNLLGNAPSNGEFVRFLAQTKIEFSPLIVDSVQEIGTIDTYLSFKSQFPVSRFFNSVEMQEDLVVKKATVPKFKHLLEDEINWYRYMYDNGFVSIPKVINFEPLEIERIRGMHPHQIKDLTRDENVILINNIIARLNKMHSIERGPVRLEDLYNVYVNKTLDRIRPVTQMLKINSDKKYVINGKQIEAITPDKPDILIKLFQVLSPISYFCPIHGDPTFSNILVTGDNKIKFIDPRGYFGNSKIFGDPRYDFAKLFYSAVGNYDQFNEQNFQFRFEGKKITIKVASSGFENVWKTPKSDSVNTRDIEILHALIWLSLSGYFINDIDSMMASYFHGLELVSEVIKRYGI